MNAASIDNKKRESAMSTMNVGKRLVPVEHVALVEPFDPESANRMQTDKAFHARVVLINRDSLLSEQTVASIAEAMEFRMLPEDGVAVNAAAVHFAVESFETPSQGFTPRKAYRSRLIWKDLEGNTQSKLLLSEPENVLAVAVRGDSNASREGGADDPATTTKPVSRRRRRRRVQPEAPAPA
jgi:hypothetical protein